MTSAGILYQTQRLTVVPNRLGGRDPTFGHDRGVTLQGIPYFQGSNSIAMGDRSSVADTGTIEALLVRMAHGTTSFACPIVRPNDQDLWTFFATKTGITGDVEMDRDLLDGHLTATAAGSAGTDGTYGVAVSLSLKTADATISNLRVSVNAGALLSVDGRLFMVTKPTVKERPCQDSPRPGRSRK